MCKGLWKGLCSVKRKDVTAHQEHFRKISCNYQSQGDNSDCVCLLISLSIFLLSSLTVKVKLFHLWNTEKLHKHISYSLVKKDCFISLCQLIEGLESHRFDYQVVELNHNSVQPNKKKIGSLVQALRTAFSIMTINTCAYQAKKRIYSCLFLHTFLIWAWNNLSGNARSLKKI